MKKLYSYSFIKKYIKKNLFDFFYTKKTYFKPFFYSFIFFLLGFSFSFNNSFFILLFKLLFFINFISLITIFLDKYKMKESNICYTYFGLRGVGKSTLATKFSLKYMKKDIPVWSNVEIKGTFKIDIKNDLGYYDIRDGLLIIDEAGIELWNRNYKNFTQAQQVWFKKSRHYNMDIIYFSQALDVDKILRELTTHLFVVRKFTPFFILTVPILKQVGICEMTQKPIDKYFFSIWGARLHLPQPTWKHFCSWQPPKLESKKWQKWE